MDLLGSISSVHHHCDVHWYRNQSHPYSDRLSHQGLRRLRKPFLHDEFLVSSERSNTMKFASNKIHQTSSGLAQRRGSFLGFVASVSAQELASYTTLAISQVILSIIIGTYLYMKSFCEDIRLIYGEIGELAASRKSAKNRALISKKLLIAGKLQNRIVE